MTSNVTSELINNITLYQYNPAAIQRTVHQALSDATNGELQVVDPTNPFVFAMEAGACMTAAFMQKAEALNRKQYAVASQTPEDLYMHMSDRDYAGRFAIAASTKFSLLLALDEVLEKLVEDPATGIRKMVLPRNTVFTVADVEFSLQYPVEIRQLAHGGLTVVYDVEKPSPLQTLETNVIKHQLRSNGEANFLFFEVDVQQFSIVSQTASLNAAQDFKVDITLRDYFYYARVYAENADGTWEEIKTTHSDQIYDISAATAVLRVVDKTVTVAIPQIYTSTKLLNRTLRMDIYQTKGPIMMLMSEYPTTGFGATFLNLDKNDDTVFTAPVNTLRTVMPYSDKVVDGGQLPLSFDELRARVIKNSTGEQSLPITPVQIETSLIRDGYEVVRSVDNVTDRILLATRGMPTPANEQLITAAAASIEKVVFKITDAVLLSSVIDNGQSITITPETLYKNVNGVTSTVTSEEVSSLLALPPEKRALAVTNGNYMYTPFHYVLDMANNSFDARPYYLDSPEIETKLFVGENDSTLLQVATDAYTIERSATGYTLHVTTLSSDAYKALDDSLLHVQLAYVPVGENARAYILGRLIGKTEDGERVFEFDLRSNFYLDKRHNLTLLPFSFFGDVAKPTLAELTTEFDLLYSTSAVVGPQFAMDDVDAALGKELLPSRIAGITHEKLRVRFGSALTRLWARARSVISAAVYDTYPADVPRYYERNVYKRDGDGFAVLIDADGKPVFQVLHAQGDPVLDAEGKQVYLHRAGDVKLDPVSGEPVIKNQRDLQREVDMMLIEGVYRFATDATSTKYRLTMTQTVVEWLINDLAPISKELLDQTRLYFYPKTTQGTLEVLVGEELTRTIAAGQSFVADLYVPSVVYDNTELKARLTKTTIEVISAALKDTVVSLDQIGTELRAAYGSDVVSVQLSGLGGNLALQALTIMDDANRCSIRKRLTVQADDTLIVEEDVTLNFIRYEAAA